MKCYADDRPLSSYMAALGVSKEDLRSLNGKELLLVGGGCSPIQKTFDRLRINCHVTNVDLYAKNPDMRATNIKQDFVFTDFENKFDEIWALWSLPVYSLDPWHAGVFSARAAIGLKPGGVLRVSPLPREVKGILLAPHLEQDEITYQTIEVICDMWLGCGVDIPVRENVAAPDKETRLMQYWGAPSDAAEKNMLNLRARAVVDENMVHVIQMQKMRTR